MFPAWRFQKARGKNGRKAHLEKFADEKYRAETNQQPNKQPLKFLKTEPTLTMKHTILTTALAALSLAMVNPPLTACAADDLTTEAGQAINAFKSADPGLTNFFNSSAGFAIFPSVAKGGLILGGEHGKALVYQQGKPVGEATLAEVNIGPQVGGQKFYEVIFFETPEAFAIFKQNRIRRIGSYLNAGYKLSAEASAVAATAGVSKDARYQEGVIVFTLPRAGLMVQATAGSQNVTFKPFNNPADDLAKVR